MENSFLGSKSNRVLLTVALLALILALGTYSTYTMKQSKYLHIGPVIISVTGEGEVTAVPDVAQFNFSVTATGTDSSKAQEASGVAMNTILSYLKEKGIEDKDIKTSDYNVYPHYRYDAMPCTLSYCPPGRQTEDGYEASQTVTVKVRNMDISGELIAGVGGLGATNISGLQFTIDDTDALEDEARTKAIADAKAKAEVLSKELDVRIIKMTGYYEENVGMPYGYGMGGNMMEKAESDSFSGPELPAGEDTVRSQVTITYMVR